MPNSLHVSMNILNTAELLISLTLPENNTDSLLDAYNKLSAENGAYPPTQNGLIHPQLLLKWP